MQTDCLPSTCSSSGPSFYKTYRVKRSIDTRSKDLSTEETPNKYKSMIINIGSIGTNETRSSSIHYFHKSEPIYTHIDNLIFRGLKIPEDWTQQGITPPNIEAKKIAQKICFSLYDDYSLIPIRIVPTKEEGVFIYYKNFNNNRTLLVEVYNNLEVAALMNDETNKRILYSEDIKNCNFVFAIEKLIEK